MFKFFPGESDQTGGSSNPEISVTALVEAFNVVDREPFKDTPSPAKKILFCERVCLRNIHGRRDNQGTTKYENRKNSHPLDIPFPFVFQERHGGLSSGSEDTKAWIFLSKDILFPVDFRPMKVFLWSCSTHHSMSPRGEVFHSFWIDAHDLHRVCVRHVQLQASPC